MLGLAAQPTGVFDEELIRSMAAGCLENGDTPFDTGCLPLSYSGNPGVKRRISQGCPRETLDRSRRLDGERYRAELRDNIQGRGEMVHGIASDELCGAEAIRPDVCEQLGGGGDVAQGWLPVAVDAAAARVSMENTHTHPSL